ncbi:hypothetical protein [Thermococcus sp. GR6]|nr:hypothetical protein [Thermococcus sp. GR6]
MELLEMFYKKGGTKEEFLRIVNEALKKWLESRGDEDDRKTP